MLNRLCVFILLFAIAHRASAQPCSCVQPIFCPEALLNNPKRCETSEGLPGVCCLEKSVPEIGIPALLAEASASRHTQTQETPTFRRERALPTKFIQDAQLQGNFTRSALPDSVQKLLNSLPNGDDAREFAIGDDAPFTRTRPVASDDTRRNLLFSSRGPQAPTISETTRLNGYNARTSLISMKLGDDALRFMEQVVFVNLVTSVEPQGRMTSAVPETKEVFSITRPALSNVSTALESPSSLESLKFIGERRSWRVSGRGEAPTSSPANPFQTLQKIAPQVSTSTLPCILATRLPCSSSSKYRTADGTCNNLVHPRWGKSFSRLRRIFPSTYDDGVFAPRGQSVSGTPLPGPRDVSVKAFSSNSDEAKFFTTSVVTFGQFIDHDLSLSPIFKIVRPDNTLESIECCTSDGSQLPADHRHPQCLPIDIAADDPFYQEFGKRCMNFVRSIPAPDPLCRPRPATQLNQLTDWLDLSQVYGSTQESVQEFRAFFGGRLKTSPGELLPRENPSGATNCTGTICFRAGDERVNENTLLVVIQTVWLREHNRVAKVLSQQHPSWDDERLFQEARRICIGEYQHILYTEWLPTIVGFPHSRRSGLSGGGFFTYSPSVDPAVSTEFSTAAFRLHSLVQGTIKLVTGVGTTRQTLKLEDSFFTPDAVTVPSLVAELARGLTLQPPENADPKFEQALRGDLFKMGPVGLDLAAINIQRGRDHAIPTYTTVASHCNGVRLDSFQSFSRFISASDINRLRSVYADYRDVDLFVGLNMERRASSALVGPTTRCLLTEQFLRARYGDRFFYDQFHQAGSFSFSQYLEIRESSWARVLCDNVGSGFKAVQPLAFIKPITYFNPVLSCSSPLIRRVDLSKF